MLLIECFEIIDVVSHMYSTEVILVENTLENCYISKFIRKQLYCNIGSISFALHIHDGKAEGLVVMTNNVVIDEAYTIGHTGTSPTFNAVRTVL